MEYIQREDRGNDIRVIRVGQRCPVLSQSVQMTEYKISGINYPFTVMGGDKNIGDGAVNPSCAYIQLGAFHRHSNVYLCCINSPKLRWMMRILRKLPVKPRDTGTLGHHLYKNDEATSAPLANISLPKPMYSSGRMDFASM